MHARAEHVGSLLRPSALVAARHEHASGRLDAATFKAVEDRAVDDAVALQRAAGCPVITDGELRRESFQSELTASCAGFAGVDVNAWLWGDWHSTDAGIGNVRIERPPDLAVVSPIRQRRGLAAEEFTYVRARVAPGEVTKVTLPSPTLFANLWSPERSTGAYPTFDAFMADVVDVLCREVRELVRLGCTYVQIDAPHYPLLIDPVWRAFYEDRGWTLDRWLSYGVDLDNAVIDAGRPATFGFHLCRGNQHSRWLVAGGYDAIAAPIFRRVRANRLLLEYDDERSGTFEPLRLVPDDRTIVLGLVTTKRSALESEAEVERRLLAAAAIVGLDRLAVGTQCGFATSVGGNTITPEAQRAKLTLIVRIAARVLSG